MDVFISLALSLAAPPLIRTISTTAVSFIVAKRQLCAGLDINGLNAAAGLTQATTLADRFLRRNDAVRELWTRNVEQTLGLVISQSSAHLTDTGAAASSDRTAANPARYVNNRPVGMLFPLEGDTASVSIRRAAYAHARVHELAAARTYDVLVAQVRSGSVTPSAAKELSTLLTKNIDPNRDDQAFEKSLSLLFEASIWVLHIGDAVQAPKENWHDLIIPAKFQKLFGYLINRFPHDQGNGEDSFISHVLRTDGRRWMGKYLGVTEQWGSTTDRGSFGLADQSKVDLLRWFGKVRNVHDRARSAFQGIGYSNLGPIKPK